MAKELPQNLKIRLPEFCTGCQIGEYEIDTLHVDNRTYHTLYCVHQRACDAMIKREGKKTVDSKGRINRDESFLSAE